MSTLCSAEPTNDDEKRQHVMYEQWLGQHTHWLTAQLKVVEEKVAKHRKTKKSLGAKQRNAKKVRQGRGKALLDCPWLESEFESISSF